MIQFVLAIVDFGLPCKGRVAFPRKGSPHDGPGEGEPVHEGIFARATQKVTIDDAIAVTLISFPR
jgi:hypothetical protein